MFEVDFKILNQKATPAIYADTLALRPAAGFEGRLFVATDSPYGVFRDTGTSWVQIASNGGGGGGSTGVNGLNGTTNIGLGGTLTNGTTINGGLNNLIFSNTNSFQSSGRVYQFLATDLINNITSITGGNATLDLQQLNNNTGVYSKLSFLSTSINTLFNGAQFGLSLNDSNGKFVLGDYSNARKYNSFVVNDDTDRFYFTTTYNQTNTDQDLLYASNNTGANERFIKLGDFNGYQNDYSLIVDDQNQFIKTTNGTGDVGIILTNSFSFFGSYNSTQYLFLSVDYGLNSIAAFNTSSTNNGLLLDYGNLLYQFGGYSGNNNYIKIDDSGNDIETITSSITFTGTALQSNTSSGNSGEHLVITLNGVQYKIKLENP